MRHEQAPRRTPASFLPAAAALLLLAGCSGGGSGPLTPGGLALSPSPGSLSSGYAVSSTDLGLAEGIPGGWTFELTTEPLQVTITPWRTAETIQGKLFDLDIGNFFTGDTLKISGVRFDPDGNVIIDYVIAHPFKAPNFAQPISAQNRADLGFTGRLLFLTDVPAGQVAQRRFFGNTVTANTDAVLNPNHYVRPGNLLNTSLAGFNANAFPVRLVVDEARNSGQGNRIGISNGGNPLGNYNAAQGGWQRTNIGASNTGWTGYDFLHQGQRAANSVIFSKDAVAAGQATFDVALLIKYTDPRGVPFPQNPQVRMPQDPFNNAVFAYRMPNGAIDVSDIKFQGLADKVLSVGVASGSTAPLTIQVRDYDARATATTEAILANDPDIAKVNIGTSGAPTVALSAPALSGTDFTFTAGGQSGRPGDEIAYAGTITNSLGTAPGASRQVGLVRVTDPENSAPGRNTYHFGVDPVTLAGDPNRAVEVITYQSIFFNIPDGNTAPTCGTLGINGSTSIAVGGTFTVNLAGAADAQNDTLAITLAYTGPGNSSTSTISLTNAQRTAETAFNPFTDTRLTSKMVPPTLLGNYTLQVTLDDSKAAPVVCSVPFTVVPNQASECGTSGINEPGPFASPADFTLNLSGITDVDSANLILRFMYTGPENDISSDFGIATSALGSETAFNPYADGRLAFPLRRPATAGDYNFMIEIRDGAGATTCGPYPFEVEAAANQPPTCGSLAGQFPKTVNPGSTFTLDLTSITDPDSSTLTLSFSYAGTSSSTSGTIGLTLGQLGSESNFNPFTDSRLTPTLVSPTALGDYTFTVNISDGTNNVQCGPYDFEVEGAPNLPPDCGNTGINGSGIIPIGGTFTVDLSDLSDPDSTTVEVGFRYTGPATSNSGTVSLTLASIGDEDQFDPFDDSRLTPTLTPPGVAGAYQLSVEVSDGVNLVTCGPYNFTVEGVTGPPSCNSGITLSKSTFASGEEVDFTVNLSAITDPNDIQLTLRMFYTGPSTSTTSSHTVPLPLPTALNPFTDPGITTKLTRPTAVGTYTFTAELTDAASNVTECQTTFTIQPPTGVTPVSDLTVEVNTTTVGTGRTINLTNTLTITWTETDAPQYAVYADFNPTVDREAPTFDPVTYKPNFPELNDELQLVGVTSTNSFTGFSVPDTDGFLLAYIVVRARATAGNPGSETADSQGAFVGILTDAEPRLSVDPFWFVQAGTTDPEFFLLDLGALELRGAGVGFDNVAAGGVAGMVGLNLPTPMESNMNRAYLIGNFFDFGWTAANGRGEVGFTTTQLTELFWSPIAAPGIAYNAFVDGLDTLLTGAPTTSNNVHASTDGLGAWFFFRYNGTAALAGGALGTFGFNFGTAGPTLCGSECPAYDEIAFVFD